jgi:chromosome transmission fidelity protein 18
MSLPSDIEVPTSFDPAIHLHSEFLDDAYETTNLSADLLELNHHIADVREQKTREGIVIQHRAWKVSGAFRSEEDYPIGNVFSLGHLTHALTSVSYAEQDI